MLPSGVINDNDDDEVRDAWSARTPTRGYRPSLDRFTSSADTREDAAAAADGARSTVRRRRPRPVASASPGDRHGNDRSRSTTSDRCATGAATAAKLDSERGLESSSGCRRVRPGGSVGGDDDRAPPGIIPFGRRAPLTRRRGPTSPLAGSGGRQISMAGDRDSQRDRPPPTASSDRRRRSETAAALGGGGSSSRNSRLLQTIDDGEGRSRCGDLAVSIQMPVVSASSSSSTVSGSVSSGVCKSTSSCSSYRHCSRSTDVGDSTSAVSESPRSTTVDAQLAIAAPSPDEFGAKSSPGRFFLQRTRNGRIDSAFRCKRMQSTVPIAFKRRPKTPLFSRSFDL